MRITPAEHYDIDTAFKNARSAMNMDESDATYFVALRDTLRNANGTLSPTESAMVLIARGSAIAELRELIETRMQRWDEKAAQKGAKR
jgi:hypothetical protein